MNYGVTNTQGRVPEAQVEGILQAAAAAGLELLDTAPLYADSETVLGRCLTEHASFRIVTKTPKFQGVPAEAAAAQLRASLERSLERLRTGRVYGLMLHDPTDLLGPLGNRLWRELEALRDEGLVERIGVSAYTGDEIDRALDVYPITLVQLPYNPLDDRLSKGGQLPRLAAAGVEVHARSLFLQGLLLQPTSKLEDRFAALRPALAELDLAATGAGLNRLEAIFAAAFACPEIDHFVCGVTSVAELDELIVAAARANALTQPFRFASTITVDERILNPARWAELEKA
jgi:aryl-alcohol dehydrogenase-like predicted oxidoreductase